MGKYDELLTEEAPSQTPSGKYAALFEDQPAQSKYAALLDEAPPQSDTPETDKALNQSREAMRPKVGPEVQQQASRFIKGLGVPTSLQDVKQFVTRSPIQDIKDIASDVSKIPEKVRNIGQTLSTSPAATVARAPLSPEAFEVYGTVAGMLAPGVFEKLRGGELDAIERSNAQVQARDTTQRVEARPEGEIPRTSDSDYAVGETQRTTTGELPQEPVSTGETVAATPQKSTYGEGITLYHSSPRKFEAFTGVGTPTGLGGNAFYFSDKPEAAYGENVVSVNVPKDKILDLSKPDIPYQNDAQIRKAGYEGTFNPSTGEYTIYDPNKFISHAPQSLTAELPTGGPSIRAVEERPIEAPPAGTILGWEEATNYGHNWLDRGGDINKVVTDFRKSGKVDEKEMGKMNAYLQRLQSVTNQAGDALRKSPNNPKLQQAYQQAVNNEQAFTEAYKPMHTVASGSLAALQGHVPLTAEAAASHTGLARRFQEFQGRPMSPEEAVKADRIAKQAEKTNVEYKQANGEVYKQLDNEYGRLRTTRKGPPTLKDLGEIFKPETLQEVCDV